MYVYNWVVKRNYSLTSICRRRLCLLSHPGDLSAFILIKQVASRFVQGFLYMVFFFNQVIFRNNEIFPSQHYITKSSVSGLSRLLYT